MPRAAKVESRDFVFSVDFDEFKESIKKNKLPYRRAIQMALAEYMTNVRKGAATEEIIENRCKPVLNPYILRKKQPSDPSRLTSRTGKMAYMLNKTKSEWSGFGGLLVKEHTPGLAGMIRIDKTGDIEAFKGTYRVDIELDGNLTRVGVLDKSRLFRMPLESTKTLALRFQHEKGVRGTVRQFMYPAASKRLNQLGAAVGKVVRGIQL